MKPERKLKKAKRLIQTKQPFYAYALHQLGVELVPGLGGSMTNGEKIAMDPEILNQYTVSETAGVIVHEIQHVLQLHHTRRRERNKHYWNVAADMVINNHNPFPLPGNPLVDRRFTNSSVEFAYKFIRNHRYPPHFPAENTEDAQEGSQQKEGQSQQGEGQQKEDQQGEDQRAEGRQGETQQGEDQQGGDQRAEGQQGEAQQGENQQEESQQGGDRAKGAGNQEALPLKASTWNIGQVEDLNELHDEMSKAAQKSEESRIRRLLLTAATATQKIQPNEPLTLSILQDYAEKHSNKSFEQIFSTFVTNNTHKDEYSWSRPNRRYIQQGFYLPQIQGNIKAANHFAVLIDISGSIDLNQLGRFQTTLNKTMEEVPNLILSLMYFNTRVIEKLGPITKKEMPVRMEFQPSGGTCYKDAFRQVQILNGEIPVNAIMVFTDLECYSYPSRKPKQPTLWVNFGWTAAEAEFGKVVNMLENNKAKSIFHESL